MYGRLVVLTSFALVLSTSFVAASTPEIRRWTDNSGKYSVDAELVEVKQDSVVLKKASGSVVIVPIARLSAADRQYLKSLAKPVAKKSITEGARENLSYPDALTQPPPWNDANPPFDLAEFLKAPPAEENAAPLYLDAFCEFDNYAADVILPLVSQEEQRQRFLRYHARNKEQMRLDEAWEKDSRSVDFAAVEAWLDEYDVGFRKLVAAQQRPKCVFQPGRRFDSHLVHAAAARDVARLVEWRIRRDLERGNLDGPINDLETVLRLSRDLRPGGDTLCQLVSFTLEDLYCCMYLTPAILNAPTIDTRHCDRLLALLIEHEAQAIDIFLEANRAEYFHDRQALHDLQHRTGSFDPQYMRDKMDFRGDVNSPLACIKLLNGIGDANRLAREKYGALARGDRPPGGGEATKIALLPGAWSGGTMLADKDYTKEVDALNRVYASILAISDQPNLNRTGDFENVVAPLREPLRATTLAVFLVGPRNWMHNILQAEATLRGTQCLVALRRWQLEHAEPPKDIETLVKTAGMPSVPIDPWSGAPLRMALNEGTSVIYSVGPDGRDDGGQLKWNEAPTQPGDLIFRLKSMSN